MQESSPGLCSYLPAPHLCRTMQSRYKQHQQQLL
ncbi:hypothetical protein D0T66_14795 [Dysgonomonas sp. 25]|nr:hypothetical protein [Dysgonomonas sp. 25]